MSISSSPLLVAKNLGVDLPDGRRLFEGLDLSIDAGRTALVGANGIGKSVLLDVLVGTRLPTAGRVVRRGRIAWVPQGRSGIPRMPGETVADRLGVGERLAAVNRVLAGSTDPVDYDAVGNDGWSLSDRVRAALDRIGLEHIPVDRAIETLSGGEAARVTLVGAMIDSPDLLILDEPTNDLDAMGRAGLLDVLDRTGSAVLMVSHDRAVLRRVDRILELTPGGLSEFGGAYDAWREARRVESAAAVAELASARAARRRARDDARRARERQDRRSAQGARNRGDGSQPPVVENARRERSQGTTSRLSRTLDEALDRSSDRVSAARDRVEESAELRVEVAPSGLPAGRVVVVARGLGHAPPGGHGPLFEGLDMTLRGPARTALSGRNGSGKTTLLRILAGRLKPDAGTVHIGVEPRRVAYLDQRTELLDGHDSVLACFRAMHPELDESTARHSLARFLFAGDSAYAPLTTLSGGERVRAALAVLLGGSLSPALLLLDEPTNHLDLPSLETVEAALATYDGALIVVSHDEDFLKAIGLDEVVVLG